MNEAPFVISGPTMDDAGAMVYSAYGKHKPAACCASCPVCDLLRHAAECEDVQRTPASAGTHYKLPFEEAVKTLSPVSIVNEFPNTHTILQLFLRTTLCIKRLRLMFSFR